MSHTYAVYKRPTTEQKIYRLKTKGWKKMFHENSHGKKKAGVAILIPDKINFKTKTVRETNENII